MTVAWEQLGTGSPGWAGTVADREVGPRFVVGGLERERRKLSAEVLIPMWIPIIVVPILAGPGPPEFFGGWRGRASVGSRPRRVAPSTAAFAVEATSSSRVV